MSDPYATPTSELRDLGEGKDLPPSAVDRTRQMFFATVSLGAGGYLAVVLLRVVIPGVVAALHGAFSWDLVVYALLLLLPALLLLKGALEFVAPGVLASLWRRG
ncbi:MAG: hypothetical protein KDD82_08055 [Planctomycetes bacterium]|nr:hypothetical protein [Planctomycetota bacterium]